MKQNKCPACNKKLTKKYLRSLKPLEWQKLQTAHWMTAWHRELDRAIQAEKELINYQNNNPARELGRGGMISPHP